MVTSRGRCIALCTRVCLNTQYLICLRHVGARGKGWGEREEVKGSEAGGQTYRQSPKGSVLKLWRQSKGAMLQYIADTNIWLYL